MRLSSLQNKQVVYIEDGSYLGKIIDIKIDDMGNILSLIVEKYKFLISLFTSSKEVEILWKDIVKIGEDVILVNFENS